MPRPRVAGRRRIWDTEELDLAFKALPREGGDDKPIFETEEPDEGPNWDGVLMRR